MDNIQKQSELLHSISNKIKDGEYKMLMENLAEIKKQKIPQFVSFISVKGVTNIKGVMMSVVNGEEEAEPYSEKISSSGGMTLIRMPLNLLNTLFGVVLISLQNYMKS